MKGDEYYGDTRKQVERFLAEKGFQKERNDKLERLGDVWSGNLEVIGKQLGIYLVIPKYFPDRLPRVHLKNRLSAPIPHLDSNLFVCSVRESGLIYNQDKFLALIEEILDRATNIVSDGISGQNDIDFDTEFLDYWMLESDGIVISLLNPNDDVGRIIIADVVNDNVKRKVASKSIEEVESYFHKMDPKYRISYRCSGWFTKLEYIPRPLFPKTIADAERSLLLQSKSHLKKYKKAIPKGRKAVPYIIFSVPGEPPLLACWGGTFKDRQHHLRKNIIERWDSERIQMRIGNQKNILKDLKLCVIGCGSIGSHVAMSLVAAGAENLVLIDSERLDIGNIARHLCGANHVDHYKVEAVKELIEQHFPYAKIVAVKDDILEIIANNISQIVSCDLVISAVGELNINRRLNTIAYSQESFPPVIFSFIESYGIASHALLVNGQSGGCFECALGNNLDFKYCVADFADTQPEMQEAGCQTTFMPYSSEDTKMAASIVIRMTIEALMAGYLQSQHKIWIGDLEEMNRLSIRRSLLYADARSFTIYTKNHGRNRDCKICGDR